MVVKITNTVNMRGKQLVMRLNEVCDSKLKVLVEKKETLQLLSDNTDHCIEFMQNALEKGSDFAILSSKNLWYVICRNSNASERTYQIQRFRCEFRCNWIKSPNCRRSSHSWALLLSMASHIHRLRRPHPTDRHRHHRDNSPVQIWRHHCVPVCRLAWRRASHPTVRQAPLGHRMGRPCTAMRLPNSNLTICPWAAPFQAMDQVRVGTNYNLNINLSLKIYPMCPPLWTPLLKFHYEYYIYYYYYL